MTAVDMSSSSVNFSRDQSADAPNRRICEQMAPPLSSFHCQTRSRNFSRPISTLFSPSAVMALSTSNWVAIPAWSVPGNHSVGRPRIL